MTSLQAAFWGFLLGWLCGLVFTMGVVSVVLDGYVMVPATNIQRSK